jgi:Undecaprenyl-phosphate glucose phosphotransferase
MYTPFFLSKAHSSATHPPSSLDVAPSESKRTAHLNTALATYAAIEVLAVACSAYFIGLFYEGIFLNSWQTDPRYILAAVFIATLVAVTSIGIGSFVAIRRQSRHIFLWRGTAAVMLAFSIFLSAVFIAKLSGEYSRVTFICQIIGVGLTVTSMRALFYSWLLSAIASNQIEAERVALFGDISHCSMFTNRLNTSGIRTVGVFQLPKRLSMKGPIIREIIAGCRALRVDDIIVLANNEFMPAMFDFASALAELPVGVHIVPVDALNVFAASQIIDLGNLQTIQVYRPPLSKFDLFIKRAFDLISAIVGLVVLSPLFLVVSIVIKLDSRGPVFFRQTRHGFNNEEIGVLKFRSMTSMEDGGQFTQAIESDPRVTRVGRIIRRTNIDELPQLFNVFLGEMSIVGPRPHATAHNALFSDVIAPFSRRHKVKPGITGWAQVNGFRGATDTIEKMQRRIEYDLHYVDNWSFLFDTKIILMTIFSKRAYMNAY